VETYESPAYPVWQLDVSTVCEDYKYPTKSSIPPEMMKSLFYEHRDQAHTGQYPIYTDGSKSGSNVGCAAVSSDQTISRRLPSNSSIYTAELTAILLALQIINNHHLQNFIIYTDSQSVVSSLQHYNTNHPVLSKIICWLIRLANRYKRIQFCWVPSHVNITGNESADKEARNVSTMDVEDLDECIPHTDYYPVIKSAIKNYWSQQWLNVENNKLREIKNNINVWHSSELQTGRTAKILTRLRIGHTLYTHGYLMENGYPPYCDDCIVPLTVKHILSECPSFTENRVQWFPETERMNVENTLREMLAEKPGVRFHIEKLIGFIQSVGIYSKV